MGLAPLIRGLAPTLSAGKGHLGAGPEFALFGILEDLDRQFWQIDVIEFVTANLYSMTNLYFDGIIPLPRWKRSWIKTGLNPYAK